MEQKPRPRRFSFSWKQQQHDNPLKAEPAVTTTIGYPIDALPLYTEKTQTAMERREICVSPTWPSSKPRGRSQSVPPSMGEGRPTSRRLVKKQPPVKPQQQQTGPSRRESAASSADNNNRFGLISSISTRMRSRSRRPSISRNNATTDGNLPTLHGPRQSDELNAIPAPRMSATLPPGFGATITRDLKQGPSPIFTAPHPRGQDREAGQINGHAGNHSPVDAGPRLRRAGAPINHPFSDEVSRIQSSKGQPDAPNARPIQTHSDRKDITIPDSLRIGRSKKIEPGPKSPKRARPKADNSNLPNYSLPKQKQEKIHHTCKDCQQKITSVVQKVESASVGIQNTGDQNATNISTPTSPQNPIATSPKPRKASWPLSSKIGIGKEEATSKQDENKETTPTPNTTKRLSPQQPPAFSRDSATNDSSASSTLVADSPAQLNPPATDILPKTSDQKENAATSTEPPSSARNSATTSTISSRSPAPAAPATTPVVKERVPRNTMTPRQDKYLAKIFVVCCQCNFWHDIPSALYAKMIIPEQLLFTEQQQPGSVAATEKRLSGQTCDTGIRNSSQHNSPEVPDNTVQCCWCSHPMAKACCTGWTTMVHLLEKHH